MRTNTKKKKTFAAGALLVVAVLTLSACGTGDDSTTSVAEVSDTGPRKTYTVLDRPFTKPDLVLTDTNGKAYDLRKETEGKPTLIYFGYTNCPDVCPLTMNNLAVAKKEVAKKVSKSELANLRLVFVTTDPERDTPAELGKWLKGIDAEIVGLTGDFDDIQAGARKLGISIAPPTKDKNGKTVSEHGTQVIAFSPKTDGGYVLYDDEATVQDYEKGLPKLLKGENP
ncbi:SCO family protein [Streptomyces sp. NBC_00487]|uniref:SCO family protein n=1 Tax=unclassified Streptomyces TaxID=2593676 RepID=UPI002E1737BC|nr:MULTISPECIES: SCO family protein [unclassified Streptomyces]